MDSFKRELRNLINVHSKDGKNNTADFILADFMNACLNAYGEAVNRRDRFDQNDHATGPADLPPQPEVTCPSLIEEEEAQAGKELGREKTPPMEVGSLNCHKLVDGHKIWCLIDLTDNYHSCNCGAGR